MWFSGSGHRAEMQADVKFSEKLNASIFRFKVITAVTVLQPLTSGNLPRLRIQISSGFRSDYEFWPASWELTVQTGRRKHIEPVTRKLLLITPDINSDNYNDDEDGGGNNNNNNNVTGFQIKSRPYNQLFKPNCLWFFSGPPGQCTTDT